jgi:hypothetical protein
MAHAASGARSTPKSLSQLMDRRPLWLTLTAMSSWRGEWPYGSSLAPVAESGYRHGIHPARAMIADIVSEELNKPPGGLGTSFANDAG